MKGTNGKDYQNNERILENQKMYNSTGDSQYLWNIKPDLEHALRSLLIQQNHGRPFPSLYEIADDLSLEWMRYYQYRREKGNPLECMSPITYARFIILLFGNKSIPDYKTVSFEDVEGIITTEGEIIYEK